MSFDPDVLHIHCPACHGALRVQCEPEGPSALPAIWTCPYCGVEHQTELGARVIWVAKGHEPESTA